MYKFLVERLGPHGYPDDTTAEILVSSLAVRGLQTTVGGVQNQVAWALTKQEYVGPSHTSTWIENMSAAHNVGYIDEADFPMEIVKRAKTAKTEKVAA